MNDDRAGDERVPERVRPGGRRTGVGAALLIGAALLASACGGGTSAGEATPTTAAPTGAAATGTGATEGTAAPAGMDAFRQCMAGKGVTLPDPGDPSATFPAPSKELAAAFQACRSTMPRGAMPANGPGMQQFAAYMTCIMDNGVAMDHSGGAPMTAPNFDDPTFQKADRACADKRPPMPPRPGATR